MEIKGQTPSNSDLPYVIAEAGVNHTGEIDRALALVDAAAAVGADAVKFQTFSADRVITPDAPAAPYQRVQTGAQTQAKMLRGLELTPADHERLIDACDAADITFLSTPFDTESADLLDRLDVAAIKVGSGDLTNVPLLGHIATFGRPMLISTGMATMPEVAEALATVRAIDDTLPVAMLHCTSAYPCPPAEANLAAIARMREQLGVPIGYSDHTTSVETPGLAVIAGARILEKHLTLDRTLEGPDHATSLEPAAFARCVAFVEQAWTLWGSASKEPTASEQENLGIIRRSIHAVSDIDKGQRIGEDDVAILRPATGLGPHHLSKIVGCVANKDIAADSALHWEDVEKL